MAKPRVHEIASEMGVPSKTALLALRDLGEFVKGPSSSIEPAVARKLRRALEGLPQEPGPFAVLDDPEGVAAVLSALRRGAAGVPDAIDLLAGSAGTLQERALADYFDNGVLFFVPVDAAPAVREAGDSPMTLGFDELPAPRGIIVVMPSEAQDRWEIMGWSVARPELQIFPLLARVDSVGRVRVSHEKPRTLTGADSRWAALGTRGRIIGGVYRTIPRRPSPSPATRHSPPPLGPQPGDGRVHVVAASRPPADLPGGSNNTDATPSPRTEPGFRRSGRWSVRGHWRRQWYARAGEHRRIWIADHTAGEPDGDLRDRTMVYVVRGEGAVATDE